MNTVSMKNERWTSRYEQRARSKLAPRVGSRPAPGIVSGLSYVICLSSYAYNLPCWKLSTSILCHFRSLNWFRDRFRLVNAYICMNLSCRTCAHPLMITGWRIWLGITGFFWMKEVFGEESNYSVMDPQGSTNIIL